MKRKAKKNKVSKFLDKTIPGKFLFLVLLFVLAVIYLVGATTTISDTSIDTLDINLSGSINLPNNQSIKFGGDDFIRIWNANYSIGIGKNAGTDTAYSTAIGDSAGISNTRDYQTALGAYAGYENTGDFQTGVGLNAGQQNTGNNTVAVGHHAGYQNTGNSQTAIGSQAGTYNTGSNQVVSGYFAGRMNRGNFQVSSGVYSGYFNTGIYQTALGHYAGNYNDGDYNTAIGGVAFDNFTEDTANAEEVDAVIPDGNYVTITGHGFGSAGTYLNLKAATTGTLPSGLDTYPQQWVVIDADTLQLSTTGGFTTTGSGTLTLTPKIIYSNSVALGYNAEPDASNQVMLGGLSVTQIKSTGSIYSSGAGDNYFAGSIGIGTTTPSHKLNVIGAANITSALIVGNSSGQSNITLYSPNGSVWTCGVNNTGAFLCS